MCAERRAACSRQRGQALVEAVVAALALVPLALLVVMLGKYQAMQQATIAASRTLAFECTVRPQACSDAAAHADLVEEVRRRHYGRIDREILTHDVIADPAPVAERNALWVDRRGVSLLERYADVGATLSSPRFDAGRSTAIGRAASGAANLLDRVAGPARFGLSLTGGLVQAGVHAHVSPSEAGNERFTRLDSLPLTLRERTAVLTDAWQASGPYGSEAHRVASRVSQGSRLDALAEARFALGYQLTLWSIGLMHAAGLEPAASSFRPYHVDVDRVPPDRIAP